MLRRLVYLPLDGDNLKLIFDILHRLEGKNPLVGFHEAKMFDVLAQIQLIIASAGNEPELKKNGFVLFSKALKAIGDAVELVGNIPEKAIEKAAVLHYGHLCYTIHRTYKSNNIPVPKEHLKRVEKAVSLLEPIAEDPKNRKCRLSSHMF